MKQVNRRTFLKQIILASTALSVLPVSRLLFPSSYAAEKLEDFKMAVLGDSILWGIGLREEHKIYNRLADWLKNDVFQDKRSTNPPVVLADSGAKIYPASKKKNKQKAKAESEDDPTILKQVSLAVDFYQREQVNPETIELILVNGGANDLGAYHLLMGLLFPNKEIINRAKKYCYGGMGKVLNEITNQFPNARIFLLGYYPLISKQTKASELPKSLLGLFGLRKLGAIINIPFYRDHLMRNILAQKSEIWRRHSDENFQAAINELNNTRPFTGSNEQRAFFVPAPFKPENCYAAPDSFMWRLVGMGRTDDEMRQETLKTCIEKGKKGFGKSLCAKSALGHPNVKGAEAYFQAIKEKMEPLISSFGWLSERKL